MNKLLDDAGLRRLQFTFAALMLMTAAAVALTAVAPVASAIHLADSNRKHWENGEVEYRFASGMQSSWKPEINDAAAMWEENVTGLTVTEVSSGTSNVIKRALLDEGTLAETALSTNDGSDGHFSYGRITFNTNYTWLTSCNDWSYHVYSVAVHEFGHFAGNLDDTFSSGESSWVMYGVIEKDDCRAKLPTNILNTTHEIGAVEYLIGGHDD